MSEGAATAAPAATPAASNSEGSAPAQSATPSPKAGQGSATPPPSKYKFDFGDGEREYSADELKANYLKGKSATQLLSKAEQRAQEAAKREAKAAALEQMAEQGDLDGMVRAISSWKGMNEQKALALAEKMLLPHIERQSLSPEQQRIRELEDRLSATEREKQEQQRAEQQRHHAEQTKRLQASMRETFSGAWKALGLPESSAERVIPRIAELMHDATDDEGNPLSISPEQIASLVRDELMEDGRALSKDMTVEQLAQWWGQDAVNKVLKWGVEQLKAKRGMANQAQAPQPAHTNGTARPKTTNGYLTLEQMREQNRKIMEGL